VAWGIRELEKVLPEVLEVPHSTTAIDLCGLYSGKNQPTQQYHGLLSHKNFLFHGQNLNFCHPTIPLFDFCHLLPRFQIRRHFNVLEDLKHLKFDQKYIKNYKDL
jgi:hypothetical protein